MNLTYLTKEDLEEVKSDLDEMVFKGYDQPWGSLTQDVLIRAYNEVNQELKSR